MLNIRNRLAARKRRIFRGQRDRLRGYSLNGKFFGVALLIEGAIVASGLWAGVEFANKYAGEAAVAATPSAPATLAPATLQMVTLTFTELLPQANGAWWMAVVGAIMLAAAELARIPLAMALRSHRSVAMRLLAVLGLAAMVLVTTKTVSQVLAQAYHPRLVAVQEATAELKLAEADLVVVASKRGSVDEGLKPLQARVDQANARIAELNGLIGEQGEAPAAKKSVKSPPATSADRARVDDHHSSSRRTWAGQQLVDQLPAAIAERDAAVAALNAASGLAGREVERVAAQERLVADARNQQRQAVMNSQLHDFTGMLLGKDPIDVTDTQLHQFLRIFVLVPSLLIAAASTLLALVAFTRHRRPKPPASINRPSRNLWSTSPTALSTPVCRRKEPDPWKSLRTKWTIPPPRRCSAS